MSQKAITKLASSGLTLEHAVALGIDVVDNAAKLDSQFNAVESLKIQYFDIDQADTGFYRIRYLEDLPGFASQLAKPQRYTQLKGATNWAYLPRVEGADWESASKDATVPLLITEGELKAACAQVYGYNTIALGGVEMWQSTKKGLSLVPPLDRFNWRSRSVTIVFDSDAATNPNVASASVRFAKQLTMQGAVVKIATLPATFDGKKQGLDDYLVAKGDLQTVLDAARPLELGEHLTKFNEAYAYVRDQDVIIEEHSGCRFKRENFINGTHANTKYTEAVVLSNGNVKKVDVSIPKAWLEWPARRQVLGIVYEPGSPRITEDGKFNSWQSWGAINIPGPVDHWHALLDYVFSEAPQDRKWFEQWCAYPIQHPGTKLYTACLFWGPETGTGKSLIGQALGTIYGAGNFTQVENADLYDRFNEWAQNKQFVLGDEISGTDKRSEADRLKNLITRPKIRINMKHLPTYEIRDTINYYFTSNHADSLFLEDQDRRIFVHRMPTAKKPREFYIPIAQWLGLDHASLSRGVAPGVSHLFEYFRTLDLAGFDPGAPAPLTAAKLEMIDHAKSDISAFIQDVQHNTDRILEEVKMLCNLPEAPDIVLNKHLLAVYDPHEKTRVTARGIGRHLAAASLKSLFVNRTAAFGTQRFYVVRNADKWLSAKPEVVRAYIDGIYKVDAKHVKF